MNITQSSGEKVFLQVALPVQQNRIIHILHSLNNGVSINTRPAEPKSAYSEKMKDLQWRKELAQDKL